MTNQQHPFSLETQLKGGELSQLRNAIANFSEQAQSLNALYGQVRAAEKETLRIRLELVEKLRVLEGKQVWFSGMPISVQLQDGKALDLRPIDTSGELAAVYLGLYVPEIKLELNKVFLPEECAYGKITGYLNSNPENSLQIAGLADGSQL